PSGLQRHAGRARPAYPYDLDLRLVGRASLVGRAEIACFHPCHLTLRCTGGMGAILNDCPSLRTMPRGLARRPSDGCYRRWVNVISAGSVPRACDSRASAGGTPVGLYAARLGTDELLSTGPCGDTDR